MKISRFTRFLVVVPFVVAGIGSATAQAATSGQTCDYMTAKACIFLKPIVSGMPLSDTNGDPSVKPDVISYKDLKGVTHTFNTELGKNLPAPYNCSNGTCVFRGWIVWPTAQQPHVAPSSGGFAEVDGSVNSQGQVSGTLVANFGTSGFYSMIDGTTNPNEPPYYPVCMSYQIVQTGATVHLTYDRTQGWIQTTDLTNCSLGRANP